MILQLIHKRLQCNVTSRQFARIEHLQCGVFAALSRCLISADTSRDSMGGCREREFQKTFAYATSSCEAPSNTVESVSISARLSKTSSSSSSVIIVSELAVLAIADQP